MNAAGAEQGMRACYEAIPYAQAVECQFYHSCELHELQEGMTLVTDGIEPPSHDVSLTLSL